MFVFELVFVLGLCRGCDLIGSWPVDRWVSCGSVDCGLWVGSGGLLIRGLLWCVDVIAVV